MGCCAPWAMLPLDKHHICCCLRAVAACWLDGGHAHNSFTTASPDGPCIFACSNLALVEEFFNKWAAVVEWEPPLAGTIAFPRLLTGELEQTPQPSSCGGGRECWLAEGGSAGPQHCCRHCRMVPLYAGEPVEAFCDRAVAEAGVLLLPATVYDHPPSVEQGRFRLGFGRGNLPECLQQLDAFLKKIHGAADR